MTCKKCQERGKTWEGDDPKCAFDGPAFDPDNWMCATMDELRDALEPFRVWTNDQNYALLNIDDENGINGLCLWATWYKNRGTTEQVWILSDDRKPYRPTEYEVLLAIDHAKASAPHTERAARRGR